MKLWCLTLIADGASDRALIQPITWLLHQKLPKTPIRIEWADLGRLRYLPSGLSDRIRMALDYYPCDVLLVHRDAETEGRDKRVAEIYAAMDDVETGRPHLCVVTVRMQEAWMLISESAVVQRQEIQTARSRW